MLKSGDKDTNGKLDFDEFIILMTFEKNEFLKGLFTKNAGSKGWLNNDEAIKVLKEAGYEVTGADIVTKFAKHDGPADGRISYQEFFNNL